MAYFTNHNLLRVINDTFAILKIQTRIWVYIFLSLLTEELTFNVQEKCPQYQLEDKTL